MSSAPSASDRNGTEASRVEPGAPDPSRPEARPPEQPGGKPSLAKRLLDLWPLGMLLVGIAASAAWGLALLWGAVALGRWFMQ